MIYKIVVERKERDSYTAYCPEISRLRGKGDSMSSSLLALQKEFLLCLHDPEAEFEILVETCKGGGADAVQEFYRKIL